jgi:lysophospholipase L1-like esterase
MLLIACCLPPCAPAADSKVNRFESAIRAFEKADETNPPPKNANLFIGSSSIVKWKTLAQDFPNVPVINRGFGGSRLTDCNLYISRIVLPYHPARIFLYAGDNDLGGGRTVDEVVADYKTFVQTVRAGQADVPIYFISIKPSPARAKVLGKAREANRQIEAWTKEGTNLHYVDVFTPMLGADGQARPELFGPDKLHMNAAGYELWKGIIAPLLK